MLRLLTLAAVAGFAAAETCEDFDCTQVLSAANGGGASAQTQKTANDAVQCGVGACGATCADTDRRVCCEPAGGSWINAAGKSMPDTDLSACVGKTTVAGATARLVPATDIADATCTSCVAGTTFGPADGALNANSDANSGDCAPVTDLSACTGKNLDGTARLVVSATADNTCTACVAGTSFGPADGSGDCVAVTACGTQQGGVTRVNGAATATADIGSCDACGAGTAGTATGNCATWRTCTGKADGNGNDINRVQTAVGTLTTQTVCTACSDGWFEATGNGDCTAHTTEAALNCGNTLATATTCAAPRAYIAGTATENAKCAPCAAGSYAAGNGNCLPHATCGTQVGGASRLTGESTTAAGTCAACTAGTFGANGVADCATQTVCGNQLADGSCSAVARALVNGASLVAAATCAPCATGSFDASVAGNGACVLKKTTAQLACGKVGPGDAGAVRSRVEGGATVDSSCAACAGTTFAALGTDNCADQTAATACTGTLLGGGSRFTATNNVIDSVCAPCAAGSYAADGNTNCAANTACGNQLVLAGECAVPRAAGDASRTVAGTCNACAAGSYRIGAAPNAGDCLAHTTCGKQANGATRLTGASAVLAGTCAACTAGTYAANGQTDCVAQITCGNDATGTPRVATGADSVVAVATCAACAGTTFAALGTDNCVEQTPATACTGKLLGGAAGSRFTATNNVVDSVCAPCAADSYAADGNTDCVAQPQCGNQVTELTCGAGVDRLTGATLLVAGTCADCGPGTWAATGLTNCATYTAAGNQVGGATRAVGRTQTSDSTSIAACAAGTYASGDAVDCVTQITCGNDATGTLRVTTGGDSVTAVATCAACAGTTFAALPTDNCVEQTPASACTGKLLGGAAGSRFTATNNVVDSVCASCAADSYAADGNTDCVAQPQCGNQVTELTCGAGVDRLTGATLLVAGTCADCGPGTWAATGLTNCATYTAAGKQVGGATRAVGRTQTSDQTSIAACAANTYAANDQTDCLANTVCGAAVPGNAALRTSADASRTVAGTCAACATGSWGTATSACTLCTVDANAATDATYTCTNADNSQISACAAGFWKDTTGAADVCKAHTVCSGTTDGAGGTNRAEVAAASATADRTCTPCAAGFWAAAGDNTNCAAVTMKCGDQVAVGGAAPVMRAVTSVATTTAEIVCGACTAGTFASSATGDCTACTPVPGAKADAAYTCTSASDSRITGNNCFTCATKTVGAAGAADTCTATCAAGFYRAGGANPSNPGLCTTCGVDANAAATGVTYTCTTGAGDRQMTGACAANFYLDESGAADICRPVTACGNQLAGACSPRVQVLAATATADRTCTPCAAGSYAAANGNCLACTAVANSLAASVNPVVAAAILTCTTAADSRVTACAATHYKVAGPNSDSCAPITACGNQLAGACSPRVQVLAATATADRTCTPCAAGTWAAANGNCFAHTTCGDQLASPTVSPASGSRLVGASTIAAGTCAACTDGTFAANGAADCAACTPVANGVGLTCASATTSRVTACDATYGWTSGGVGGHDTCVAACPCGKWAKPWSTGQPLRCTTHSTCGAIQASGTLRDTTTAGTATTNTVCADCAAGTFAADMWTKCALVTACGNQLTCGARVEVDAATTTKDRTCTACADGTYAAANGNCVECTAVSGASAVTCTTNANSQPTTCEAQCPKMYDAGVVAAGGVCWNTCIDGYWDNSNTCDKCTAVTNAGAVTCTSATTSKVTSGACNNGYFLTAGTADICTKDTVCDASRPQVTAATDTADTVCTACPTGEGSAVSGGVCAKTTTAAPAATTAAPGSATTAAPGSGTGTAPAGGVAAGNTATIGFASIVLAVFAAVGL